MKKDYQIKKDNINSISREQYGVENLRCPICDVQFNKTILPIVNINGLGYCLNCFTETLNKVK